MLSNIFSAQIDILGQTAAFAEARHGLLAGNVANMDTPGYKTRDLSVETFQAQLKEAIERQNQPAEPHSPGLPKVGEGDPLRDVKETMTSILYHDQSDIGLEEQVMELANNQLTHNMAVALLTHQFKQLQTAISERV